LFLQEIREIGQNIKKVEACGTPMVFDRFLHRRHLGHFYVQDIAGKIKDLKKRDRSLKEKKLNMIFRFVIGIVRGIVISLFDLITKIPFRIYEGYRQPDKYTEIKVVIGRYVKDRVQISSFSPISLQHLLYIENKMPFPKSYTKYLPSFDRCFGFMKTASSLSIGTFRSCLLGFFGRNRNHQSACRHRLPLFAESSSNIRGPGRKFALNDRGDEVGDRGGHA
jgi:hypothetical protein